MVAPVVARVVFEDLETDDCSRRVEVALERAPSLFPGWDLWNVKARVNGQEKTYFWLDEEGAHELQDFIEVHAELPARWPNAAERMMRQWWGLPAAPSV